MIAFTESCDRLVLYKATNVQLKDVPRTIAEADARASAGTP
jgi:hypothetical protein